MGKVIKGCPREVSMWERLLKVSGKIRHWNGHLRLLQEGQALGKVV